MTKPGKRSPRKSTPKPGAPDDARRTTSTSTRRRRKLDHESESDALRLASDTATAAEGSGGQAGEYAFQAEVVTELANCLWYLKTKYFRRQWHDEESTDSDPRARHALRRIDRGIRALGEASIRLVDPTGTRYPPGGEGLMTPLQFEPMAGISTDTVSETVRPMVFSGNRLIQRGEVFVSVPVRDRDLPGEGERQV